MPPSFASTSTTSSTGTSTSITITVLTAIMAWVMQADTFANVLPAWLGPFSSRVLYYTSKPQSARCHSFRLQCTSLRRPKAAASGQTAQRISLSTQNYAAAQLSVIANNSYSQIFRQVSHVHSNSCSSSDFPLFLTFFFFAHALLNIPITIHSIAAVAAAARNDHKLKSSNFM